MSNDGGSIPRRLLSLEVGTTLIWRKMLDGIPQHCSGHDCSMLIEKRFENGLRFLSDFSQHPACCLVDQVFLVLQQFLANLQRIGEVVISNEVLRRDDGDPALPKGLRFGEFNQRPS